MGKIGNRNKEVVAIERACNLCGNVGAVIRTKYCTTPGGCKMIWKCKEECK